MRPAYKPANFKMANIFVVKTYIYSFVLKTFFEKCLENERILLPN